MRNRPLFYKVPPKPDHRQINRQLRYLKSKKKRISESEMNVTWRVTGITVEKDHFILNMISVSDPKNKMLAAP